MLNLEKKTIGIVGLFALTAIGIALGIIWPTIRYIKKINQETETLRLYLQKKYDATISLRSSVHKIAQIKSAVSLYPDRLFHVGDELKLITALEKIAAEDKVSQKIEGSNLDKLIPGQNLNLSLNIRGEYLNTLKYLADLKKLDYFIIAEQAQWAPLFNSAEPSSVSAAIMYLNLSLYVSN